MLNKRLLSLVIDVKKYIAKIVFFQWLSLVCNIAITFFICRFLNFCLINKTVTDSIIFQTIFVILICIIFKSVFTKMSVTTSTILSQKAKSTLRNLIFNKLVKIGISYKNYISTAETVQVSIEGIEQLEIYFSQYAPQIFYSLVSIVTLFVILSFVTLKT